MEDEKPVGTPPEGEQQGVGLELVHEANALATEPAQEVNDFAASLGTRRGAGIGYLGHPMYSVIRVTCSETGGCVSPLATPRTTRPPNKMPMRSRHDNSHTDVRMP